MTALKAKDITLIRRLLVATILLALGMFVVITARWHMMWDTQVMHYVDFLIAHGFAPYRTIGDMNMPGAYWSEHLGITVFGPTDLAWRFYEFFLLGLFAWGVMLIASHYDLLAGLLATTLFILIHGIDDARNAVQRDEVMTIALVLAVAALFAAVRRNSVVLALGSGLLFGFATAIKPTALLLAIILIAAAAVVMKKRDLPPAPVLVAGFSGVFLVGLGVLFYLHHFRSTDSFAFILRRVLPAYAPMDSFSLWWLLSFALTPIGWVLLVLSVFTAGVLVRARESIFGDGVIARWEQMALITSFFFGLGSYLLQHKGYAYHRYPALAFGLLWACIVLMRGLKSSKRPAVLAALLSVVFVVMMVVPLSLAAIAQLPSRDVFAEQLAVDLKTLGPDQLQHQVQCLDVVFGCMNALYHDGIVQNYGATGDLLYFQPNSTPVVEYYRNDFWQHLQVAPPEVFILSNQWFGGRHTFDKVGAWPQFDSYLKANFIPVAERAFTLKERVFATSGTDRAGLRAYRIYIRKGSPLLAAAQRLQP